jgi:hypothetical protein
MAGYGTSNLAVILRDVLSMVKPEAYLKMLG